MHIFMHVSSLERTFGVFLIVVNVFSTYFGRGDTCDIFMPFGALISIFHAYLFIEDASHTS
jgi:hypothetical protein